VAAIAARGDSRKVGATVTRPPGPLWTPAAEAAHAARQAMLDALDDIAAETAKAVASGGEKATARHHARG
jgi:hypothetical protein